MKMWDSIPAAAAYAARALAALPAEGIATLPMPSSLHMAMAQDSPRALNDAVGFVPSSFTQRASAPSREPSRRARHIGVQPSPSVTTEPLAGGRTGAYRHMLAGPLDTSRRGHRCRMVSRS